MVIERFLRLATDILRKSKEPPSSNYQRKGQCRIEEVCRQRVINTVTQYLRKDQKGKVEYNQLRVFGSMLVRDVQTEEEHQDWLQSEIHDPRLDWLLWEGLETWNLLLTPPWDRLWRFLEEVRSKGQQTGRRGLGYGQLVKVIDYERQRKQDSQRLQS